MPARPKPKCERCRTDRQKCEPENRQWPSEKCDRCRRFQYPCSAPTLPSQTSSMHIGCSLDDLQTFLGTKHDVSLTVAQSSVVETSTVYRLYLGERENSSLGEDSPNKEEDLSLPPLHLAVTRKQRPPPDSFQQRVDLNERDADNATPLHRAVRQNDKDWVQWLINQGCDVNAQDKNGHTPLHMAAACDRDGSVTEILIRCPVDVLIVNSNGQTALHTACDRSPSLRTMQKFVQWYYHLDTRHVNMPDRDGNTPLHHAADDYWIVHGRIDELVSFKAEVDAKNNKGETPLHTAVWGQRSDTVQTLLRHRASTDAVDSEGQTPLFCLIHGYGTYLNSAIGKCQLSAGCYEHLPIIFHDLLDNNAKVTIRDSHGSSPLMIALKWYLEWTIKDAFEKDDAKDGLFDGPPRVKVASQVKRIWEKDILPRLHNVDIEQSQA